MISRRWFNLTTDKKRGTLYRSWFCVAVKEHLGMDEDRVWGKSRWERSQSGSVLTPAHVCCSRETRNSTVLDTRAQAPERITGFPFIREERKILTYWRSEMHNSPS